MTAFATFSVVAITVLSAGNAFAPIKQASFARRGDVSMDAGRIPLVAGNWKMNTDLISAVALATELAELTASVDSSRVEIAVCPPFPFLRDVKMVINNQYYHASLSHNEERSLNAISLQTDRLWRTKSLLSS
jgi:Triosephosphate isomerase